MNPIMIALAFFAYSFFNDKKRKEEQSILNTITNPDTLALLTAVGKLSDKKSTHDERMTVLLELITNPIVLDIVENFFQGGIFGKKTKEGDTKNESKEQRGDSYRQSNSKDNTHDAERSEANYSGSSRKDDTDDKNCNLNYNSDKYKGSSDYKKQSDNNAQNESRNPAADFDFEKFYKDSQSPNDFINKNNDKSGGGFDDMFSRINQKHENYPEKSSQKQESYPNRNDKDYNSANDFNFDKYSKSKSNERREDNSDSVPFTFGGDGEEGFLDYFGIMNSLPNNDNNPDGYPRQTRYETNANYASDNEEYGFNKKSMNNSDDFDPVSFISKIKE